MRHFIISAAAFAALVASVPAKADMNNGPLQNAGKCWSASPGYAREASFGYWGSCPKTASVAVTRKANRRHRG